MKVSIITYNHRFIKIGVFISTLGLIIIFLNLVSFIWANYGMIIVFLGIITILTGFFMVDYYSKQIKIIGYLFIRGITSEIAINDSLIEIENGNYFIKFSESGYKGKHNYKPFLRIGAFTTNPGINKIEIFNGTNKYSFEILLNSEFEYYKFKNELLKKFKPL